MGRMLAPAYQAIAAMQGYPQDHADQHEQPQPVRPVVGCETKQVESVLHCGIGFPDHVAVSRSLDLPTQSLCALPGRHLAARSPGSQQDAFLKAGIGSMADGAIRQGPAAAGNPVTNFVDLDLRPQGGILDPRGHQQLFHRLAFCRGVQPEFRPVHFAVVVLIQSGDEFGPVLAILPESSLQGFPANGLLAVARGPIPAAHQVHRGQADRSHRICQFPLTAPAAALILHCK